ncbi:ankyrin repeat domain-containing protein 27-like [Periplaneta americana]|uniref:ankyrin repeat domain-containing protein 27-like n=1 Tax=Periplaneta americana TaxID=6978 RepID=UPI0037E8E85D
MDSCYDEDLNENSFFQVLKTDHKDIFLKATLEGWVICVPRAGSLPKYTLTHEDFFSHILVPSDELPESHFRTLNDKEIKICNRVITVEQNDISRPYSTHILFEETFYTDDLLKYKVICVECPLERHTHISCGQSDEKRIVTVQTLRDCIDLLWTQSAGREILEKMDEAIQDFLTVNTNLELQPLQFQRDVIGTLYTSCLQIALKDSRLREKSNEEKHLLDNVKLSVETYVHHGIYKKLIKGITACTAYEDACLNKVIRNLSDVQLRDLEVRSDLYEAVPRAKGELSRIEGYSTVLGKIGCLKRMILSISKPNIATDVVGGNVVAADDLLPMIVFLIIKTSLPNWIAHLTYMKQFRFSSCSTCHVDEHSFLITTLEAAIEHIKSGILLGPSAPEAQHVYENHDDICCTVEAVPEKSKKGRPAIVESSCITYFFDQIRLGNIDYVEQILSKSCITNNSKFSDSSLKNEDLLPRLCHPLCSCDKCESLLTKSFRDTTPTIHSCDDRGFTALHVACLFGRPLIVELLLSAGSNKDASDYSGSTPLHYAAAKGHQNALLLLVHFGAVIDTPDNDGNTPLHLASNNGHEGCVKALLYYAEHTGSKLNTNSENSNGDTPLHFAARWGYENIVQILLEYGASPHVENKRRLTPLDYAHNLHVSKLLISSKIVQNSKSLMQEKIVESSPDKGSIDIAVASKPALDFTDDSVKIADRHVINRGKEQHGVRPQSTEQIMKVEKLLRAIAFGDTRLASFYLGLDGPVSVSSDSEVQSATDIRSLCHPLCICEKCQPDSSDNFECDIKFHKEILNVNACNSDGFTPLHISAMHGRTDVVRLLLDAGAQINVVTRTRGVTPLHLACQNQRFQAAKLILETGNCDLDIQDSGGNTALHYASFTGNARLVDLILKYGPLLDLKNSNGKTPLNEAEEKMALSVVRLLRGGKTNSLLPWEKTEET